MTTATLPRTTTGIHAALEAAVHAYEAHRDLPRGYYETSPAATRDGHHLHLRARIGGSRFLVGAAVPGLDDIRVVAEGTCPVCGHREVPARVFTITYEQLRKAA